VTEFGHVTPKSFLERGCACATGSCQQQTFVRNVIIEGVPHENKMAGKGRIISEKARKR
jgi:hypothetical protein